MMIQHFPHALMRNNPWRAIWIALDREIAWLNDTQGSLPRKEFTAGFLRSETRRQACGLPWSVTCVLDFARGEQIRQFLCRTASQQPFHPRDFNSINSVADGLG